LADHVKTFVGGALRDERHPSYQAWSYESHLRQFNEYVYSNELSVNSCAYLHNCERDNVIRDLRFASELNKAPIFIKGELTGLRDLVKAKIKKGAGLSALERIDASAIRPSKQLADAVGSMLEGNEEFVLLDEQKTVLEKIVNASTKGMVDKKQVLIIKGGPGTGKSVISINALARLSGLRMNARYITPNAAPRAVFESKLHATTAGVCLQDLVSFSRVCAGV